MVVVVVVKSYSEENWCCRHCQFCHVCGLQTGLLQCDHCLVCDDDEDGGSGGGGGGNDDGGSGSGRKL